jgi:hypothetical protein
VTGSLGPMAGEVHMLIACCLAISAIAAASIAYPVAQRAAQRSWDRQHQDWLDSIEPDDASATCPAAGSMVNEYRVSNDGHLFGSCPGCGKTNVSCSVLDEHYYLSAWLIDDHEPRIDPDLGLHGGECWENKNRTGDYGLCVCARVESGTF